MLNSIPEYRLLLDAVVQGRSTAVTGVGQINRSHMIAALHADTSKPIVILCQDDIAAKKLQEELKAFLGIIPPILPGRELTLYDTAVVSRAWEQKRLRQLYELMQGKTNFQIMPQTGQSAAQTVYSACSEEADWVFLGVTGSIMYFCSMG